MTEVERRAELIEREIEVHRVAERPAFGALHIQWGEDGVAPDADAEAKKLIGCDHSGWADPGGGTNSVAPQAVSLGRHAV